jgi:hypothetical protein
MPKLKRATRVGEDWELSFGKHKGKRFSQIAGRSFRYIVWLAGYCDYKGEVLEAGRAAARNNGLRAQVTDSNWHDACLHCSTDTLGKERDKIYRCTVAGDTEEETMALLELYCDSAWVKRFHGLYTAWLHIRKTQPDSVEAARLYLEANKLCLYCGHENANAFTESCGCAKKRSD